MRAELAAATTRCACTHACRRELGPARVCQACGPGQATGQGFHVHPHASARMRTHAWPRTLCLCHPAGVPRRRLNWPRPSCSWAGSAAAARCSTTTCAAPTQRARRPSSLRQRRASRCLPAAEGGASCAKDKPWVLWHEALPSTCCPPPPVLHMLACAQCPVHPNHPHPLTYGSLAPSPLRPPRTCMQLLFEQLAAKQEELRRAQASGGAVTLGQGRPTGSGPAGGYRVQHLQWLACALGGCVRGWQPAVALHAIHAIHACNGQGAIALVGLSCHEHFVPAGCVFSVRPGVAAMGCLPHSCARQPARHGRGLGGHACMPIACLPAEAGHRTRATAATGRPGDGAAFGRRHIALQPPRANPGLVTGLPAARQLPRHIPRSEHGRLRWHGRRPSRARLCLRPRLAAATPCVWPRGCCPARASGRSGLGHPAAAAAAAGQQGHVRAAGDGTAAAASTGERLLQPRLLRQPAAPAPRRCARQPDGRGGCPLGGRARRSGHQHRQGSVGERGRHRGAATQRLGRPNAPPRRCGAGRRHPPRQRQPPTPPVGGAVTAGEGGWAVVGGIACGCCLVSRPVARSLGLLVCSRCIPPSMPCLDVHLRLGASSPMLTAAAATALPACVMRVAGAVPQHQPQAGAGRLLQGRARAPAAAARQQRHCGLGCSRWWWGLGCWRCRRG